MKKIIVTLAVLLLAAPAMAADVEIVCTATGPNEVTVSFTETAPGLVRAIALDVQIDDPNVVIADVNCVSAGYFIYPGSISIDAGGTVTDYGTCAGAQDGNTMTSEQGSLYAGADPLPVPGDLFILTLSGCTQEAKAGIVAVTVSENALRGGVVMEDPDQVVTVGLTGCDADVGCWTAPIGCPCLGDMNGDEWLSTADLSLLFTQLGNLGSPYYKETTADDCGDMNGDLWLSTADLSLLFTLLGNLGSPYYTQCP